MPSCYLRVLFLLVEREAKGRRDAPPSLRPPLLPLPAFPSRFIPLPLFPPFFSQPSRAVFLTFLSLAPTVSDLSLPLPRIGRSQALQPARPRLLLRRKTRAHLLLLLCDRSRARESSPLAFDPPLLTIHMADHLCSSSSGSLALPRSCRSIMEGLQRASTPPPPPSFLLVLVLRLLASSALSAGYRRQRTFNWIDGCSGSHGWDRRRGRTGLGKGGWWWTKGSRFSRVLAFGTSSFHLHPRAWTLS